MKQKSTNNALIIFIKNPILGKVKTRLAADIGEEKALQIYKECIQLTLKECTSFPKIETFIFFSDFIEESFENQDHCFVQKGDDLGEKMKNAFKKMFDLNYKNVMIIGSDLPQINKKLITNGFNCLQKNDVVIGPSIDGGYYLLAMKNLHDFLFEDMTWSNSEVFNKTISKLKNNNLSLSLLETHRDLDNFRDLLYFMKKGYFS
ncbi:MAG: TIGR04282 family arsenosugar biosynthesis glycosyltransferase [Flavobacteriia bacterium]|nr:TIGR04282 family arsenosugar biosynthesis glycosyltransferase [Flavobacteriia bacterium]